MSAQPKLELFFRAPDHPNETRPINVPADATVWDLRQAIETKRDTIGNAKLSFAGTSLDDDDAALADVGLSMEDIIDIATTLSQWELIQQTFRGISTPDSAEWWKKADKRYRAIIQQCESNLQRKMCVDEAMCKDRIWTEKGFIECNESRKQIVKIFISVSARTPFKLHGPLSLISVPDSVESFIVVGQTFPIVDFDGLLEKKSLWKLELRYNEITTIKNYEEVKKSSVENLNLNDNQLSGPLNVAEWVGPESKLRSLNMCDNQFSDLIIGDVTYSSLYDLRVSANPFVTMDFNGVTQLNHLKDFSLAMARNSQHLLTQVRGMSELEGAPIQNRGALCYLMEHHAHVPGVHKLKRQFFFRAPDEIKSIVVPSGATVWDLRQAIEAELDTINDVKLSFGGKALDDDDAALTDVDLPMMGIMDVTTTPSQWELIKQTFQDISTEDSAEWWKQAEQHYRDIIQECGPQPQKKMCIDKAMCKDPIWTAKRFITCNESRKQIVKINIHESTPFKLDSKLHEPLSLISVPDSVESFIVHGQTIPTVDFTGLLDKKSLWVLALTKSHITTIKNYEKVKKSSVELLYLHENQLVGPLNVAEWVGPESKLIEMDMRHNQFSNLIIGDVTDSPLVELDVSANPFVAMDVDGVTQLNKLKYFKLDMEGTSRHLLTQVHGISKLERAAIQEGNAYGYLMKRHAHVSGVHVTSDVSANPIETMRPLTMDVAEVQRNSDVSESVSVMISDPPVDGLIYPIMFCLYVLMMRLFYFFRK